VAPQISKSRFNTLVSHKGVILFGGRRRSRQQRGVHGDFVNLKTRRISSSTQSIGDAHRGRVCAYVHRSECVRICVGVFDCTSFRKKKLVLKKIKINNLMF
jgi:hypothetical protein